VLYILSNFEHLQNICIGNCFTNCGLRKISPQTIDSRTYVSSKFSFSPLPYLTMPPSVAIRGIFTKLIRNYCPWNTLGHISKIFRRQIQPQTPILGTGLGKHAKNPSITSHHCTFSGLAQLINIPVLYRYKAEFISLVSSHLMSFPMN